MPEQSVGGMDIEAVARRLDAAWEQRQPIAPLSESMVLTADQAYAVQTRWTELRQARGERVVGRKIGLTAAPSSSNWGSTSRTTAVCGSRAISRRSMGVSMCRQICLCRRVSRANLPFSSGARCVNRA